MKFKDNLGIKHLEKRQHEGYYRGLTSEQYQARAENLLGQKVGGDIDGYTTSSGKIVRWNTVTNDYATSKDGVNITTLFPFRGGRVRFERLRKLDMEDSENGKD